MNPRDLLWHRRTGWERMPDVVSTLPRVVNSGLAAVDATRLALDSTMEALDAAKAGSKAGRRVKPLKSRGSSAIRGGLIVVGGTVVIGLGSAVVSSIRQRESSTDDAA
jgi:hypothetical protein